MVYRTRNITFGASLFWFMLIERGIFLGNALASLYGLKNQEYYPFFTAVVSPFSL